MHAVDFKNCSEGISGVNDGKPYCPNLAELATTGVNYVAANTSKPSDSFPGLMTIITGATPRTMGVYYDVAYDRSLDGPAGDDRERQPALAPARRRRQPAIPLNMRKASTSTRPRSTAAHQAPALPTAASPPSTRPSSIAIQ